MTQQLCYQKAIWEFSVVDKIKQAQAEYNFRLSLVMNKNTFKDKLQNKEPDKLRKCQLRNTQKQTANRKTSKAVSHLQQKQAASVFDDAAEDQNQLEDIFAETRNHETRFATPLGLRNKSCIAFQKQHIAANVCKFIKKQDQQQQTPGQQSPLHKIRRHSHSLQSQYKHFDSLLVQSLQERLQFYSFRIKIKRIKSLNNINNSQSKDQTHSAEINFEKLVLWTESKMEKFIKEFFQYISANHKFHDLNKNVRKISQHRHLINCLKKYLTQRFKTEKLAKQNFINLCYSLQIHLKKAQSEYSKHFRPNSLILVSKLRVWSIVDRILIGQYDYEDISFYLYIKELFSQQALVKSSEKLFYELNSIPLKQFLNALTNNDSQLVAYYLSSFKGAQERGLVDRESILQIILNDFKVKKEKMRKNFVGEEHNQQRNKRNIMSKINYDTSFWAEEPLSRLPFASFFQRYKSQLWRQCSKLVDILCCDHPKPTKQLILRLVISKSTRIINALAQNNQQKLYPEFGFAYLATDKPRYTTEQITLLQVVQNLMLHYKDIVEQSRAKQVQMGKLSRFFKQLLVCKPILVKLEELLDAFQIK